MHDVESGRVKDGGRLRERMRHWRQYLLGRKPRVEPFTQQLFVVYPTDYVTHKALGGQVFLDQHLVLSQIGPLFIVGLLGHKQLSVSDLRFWESSRVRPEGGQVKGVEEWKVGSRITVELMRLLFKHDYRIKKKIVDLFGPNGSAKPVTRINPPHSLHASAARK